MKLADVFPSNYVKADDLQGRTAQVVISKAVMETLGNDQKLVLYFQNKEKGMVCNKTNASRISYLYGEDTDAWIGKEIVLYSEFVEFQGRTVKGLRVRPPNKRNGAGASAKNGGNAPTAKAAPQHVEPPRDDYQDARGNDMDDEISF